MAYALPVASLALTALGTLAAVQGARQQSQAAQQMGEYNAAVAESNAKQAQQEADYNANLVRERNRKLVSSQRAAYGASGITLDDSAADVMEDTVVSGELDALAEQYKGKVAFTRGQQQATLSRLEGSNLSRSYGAQAAGSLLSGVSNMAGYAYSVYGPRPSNPKMAY